MSVVAVGAACLGLAVLGAGLWRWHLAASLAVIALTPVMAVSTYQSVEARARHLNGLPHASARLFTGGAPPTGAGAKFGTVAQPCPQTIPS